MRAQSLTVLDMAPTVETVTVSNYHNQLLLDFHLPPLGTLQPAHAHEPLPEEGAGQHGETQYPILVQVPQHYSSKVNTSDSKVETVRKRTINLIIFRLEKTPCTFSISQPNIFTRKKRHSSLKPELQKQSKNYAIFLQITKHFIHELFHIL